ncbi:LPXTG cell wall anchor domain-containing protein [Virgibacillus dakarensis]|nr:LPXTG cell wall anchor domain-containing protein [Virgibacillus dakarensis]
MDGIAIGSTIKKKFFLSLLGGLLIFGSFIATLGFTGTVFALPLGGMGDFYVKFDKLEGEGFTLNPQIGETGNQDAAPLVRNQMDSATIENLHIYKDLKLPTGNWIRVNIKANQPTIIEGLIQDARFIDANLTFDDMAIEQTNTASMSVEEAFQKNWTQNANLVTITDAKIVTDYLFQNMVTLNGAEIFLESIKEPDQSVYVSGNSDGADKNLTAMGGNNNGNGGGSNLPDTASNLFLPIIIGAVLVLVGIVLLFRRKRGRIAEES